MGVGYIGHYVGVGYIWRYVGVGYIWRYVGVGYGGMCCIAMAVGESCEDLLD